MQSSHTQLRGFSIEKNWAKQTVVHPGDVSFLITWGMMFSCKAKWNGSASNRGSPFNSDEEYL